jgi:hypothetical protein
MQYNLKNIRKTLYGILKSPGHEVKSIKLFDESGTETIDPVNANRFFVELKSFSPKIESYKVLVALRQLGQKSHIDIKTPYIDNEKDFDELIKLVKYIKLAIGKKEGIKINWQKFDKEIDMREEAMHNIKESKDVSKLKGTTKSSFQRIGSSTLIVRHTDHINENSHGARTRKIRALFIENKDGERYNYPHKHIAGARAFARHISHGGTNYDTVAKRIINLSEDYLTLKRVIKEMRILKGMEADTLTLKYCTEAINRRLKSMRGPKGYEIISKEIISENMITDMNSIDDIHKRLVETCQCQQESPFYSDLAVAAKYMSQQPDINSPAEYSWSGPINTNYGDAANYDDLYNQIMELVQRCNNPHIANELRAIAFQVQDSKALNESDVKIFLNAVDSAIEHNKTMGILSEQMPVDSVPEENELHKYLGDYELNHIFKTDTDMDDVEKADMFDPARSNMNQMNMDAHDMDAYDMDAHDNLPTPEMDDVETLDDIEMPVHEESFWDNVKMPDQPKKPESSKPETGQYDKKNPKDIDRLKKDLETGNVKMTDKSGKPVELTESAELIRLKKLSGIS